MLTEVYAADVWDEVDGLYIFADAGDRDDFAEGMKKRGYSVACTDEPVLNRDSVTQLLEAAGPEVEQEQD